MSNTPTLTQIKAFNAILTKLHLQDEKRTIIRTISGGRTESTKELTDAELQGWLDQYKQQAKPKAQPLPYEGQKMVNKIIAQAREMGWITRYKAVEPDGNVVEKSNYQKLYDWMRLNSYLKKPLKDYKANELPKLVSQFEKVYFYWLQNGRTF